MLRVTLTSCCALNGAVLFTRYKRYVREILGATVKFVPVVDI